VIDRRACDEIGEGSNHSKPVGDVKEFIFNSKSKRKLEVLRIQFILHKVYTGLYVKTGLEIKKKQDRIQETNKIVLGFVQIRDSCSLETWVVAVAIEISRLKYEQ
jgi:hypothetical protein